MEKVFERCGKGVEKYIEAMGKCLKIWKNCTHLSLGWPVNLPLSLLLALTLFASRCSSPFTLVCPVVYNIVWLGYVYYGLFPCASVGFQSFLLILGISLVISCIFSVLSVISPYFRRFLTATLHISLLFSINFGYYRCFTRRPTILNNPKIDIFSVNCFRFFSFFFFY